MLTGHRAAISPPLPSGALGPACPPSAAGGCGLSGKMAAAALRPRSARGLWLPRAGERGRRWGITALHFCNVVVIGRVAIGYDML